MTDFLVEHALDNVWCAPRQDMQAIVQPARITPPLGVWNTVKVLWRTFDLPVKGARFHVYTVGQLHPLLLGLFPIENHWVSMAAVCNKQKMIVDLYVSSGMQLPRFESWYMVTADKALVIAVLEQDIVPIKLEHETLYFRVYTNAWFNNRRGDPANRFVQVEGSRPLNPQMILDLQHRFEETLTLPGYTYSFVNGMKVSKIDLFTVNVGDVVEYVYDGSIKHVIDFTVGDLRFFSSTLDTEQKYLLHYLGLGDKTIDYHDDIDFFIMKNLSADRYKGVYLHRNRPEGKAVRMVTHKDYALSVMHFNAIVALNPEWTNPQELVIRMHVRHSGWDRKLVFENNRISEMYKLHDTDVREAMLGIHSNVSNWRAEVLEASPYTEIMRSDYDDVTKPLVEAAYGYNAISKLLADTPSFVRLASNQKVIDIPYGLRNISTGYEYDDAGKYLSRHTHLAGAVYGAREDRARLIEMICGEADDILDEIYGEQTSTIDTKYSYRFYTCPIINGVITNKWEDVTGTGSYLQTGNQVRWVTDPAKVYTLIRSDKTMLAYTLSLPSPDGLLRFSLTHQAYRGGVIGRYVMQIPMGELDLMLNKRSLIENIDYYVNFPEIVIVNKEYLVNQDTQPQVIDIRFTGFCTKDFKRVNFTDAGFVKQGLLSRNNRYDIREDKVLRMIVDGYLYDRSELQFSEENSGVGVPGSRNGAPYLIRDIIVPLRNHTTQDTYVMRAASEVIDKRVSDYLTEKLPEPPMDGPNPINHRFKVVSPFACKIMNDLISGVINDPRIYQQFNDTALQEICAPYLPLLKYDPSQDTQNTDFDYVVIHPHNLNHVVDMGAFQYRFLQRAVSFYLNGKVALSNFIAIKSF